MVNDGRSAGNGNRMKKMCPGIFRQAGRRVGALVLGGLIALCNHAATADELTDALMPLDPVLVVAVPAAAIASPDEVIPLNPLHVGWRSRNGHPL